MASGVSSTQTRLDRVPSILAFHDLRRRLAATGYELTDRKRLATLLTVLLLLAIAAAGATYGRYQSLDPCDWMEQDLAATFGLTALVVEARIRADFLLQGIVDPSPTDCLLEWWRLRRDGLVPPS